MVLLIVLNYVKGEFLFWLNSYYSNVYNIDHIMRECENMFMFKIKVSSTLMLTGTSSLGEDQQTYWDGWLSDFDWLPNELPSSLFDGKCHVTLIYLG